MSFAEVTRRTWEKNILFSVLLEITDRCPLDCFFCYRDRDGRDEALSFEEYRRLLRDLREMGVLDLTLTGGEPLHHPRFFDLGREARDLGFVLRIKTCGHTVGLDSARRLREEVSPFSLDVSIHGATAEVHEKQTGVPGSFPKLMENLRAMKDAGLRVKLVSVLTGWNEHQVDKMYSLADEFGLPLQFDPQVTRRNDGDPAPTGIAATDEGLKSLLRTQLRRGESVAQPECAGVEEGGTVTKHCGAASCALAIDPRGNVFPCVAWRRSLGNIRTTPVRRIWAGGEMLETCRTLTAEAKEAVDRHGPLAHTMGFCPGEAERISGNPREVYPSVLRVHRLREEVRREEGTAPPGSPPEPD